MLDLYMQAAVVLAAILVFVGARKMVRSTVLYYVFGVIMGILGSLLVVMLGIQKLLPGVSVLLWCVLIGGLILLHFQFIPVPVYFGGVPIIFYLYYKLWLNLGVLVRFYSKYLISYLVRHLD